MEENEIKKMSQTNKKILEVVENFFKGELFVREKFIYLPNNLQDVVYCFLLSLKRFPFKVPKPLVRMIINWIINASVLSKKNK